jgi:hypothetical protein
MQEQNSFGKNKYLNNPMFYDGLRVGTMLRPVDVNARSLESSINSHVTAMLVCPTENKNVTA